MAHRIGVLHVVAGSARDRLQAASLLDGLTSTRGVLTPARGQGTKAEDVAEIGRLTGRAVSGRCRVLHAHGADGAWHAWKAAGAVGGRYGISVQGPDVLVGSHEDMRMRGALVFARIVVVPSQFLADVVLGRAVPHARVHVVPPGVPLGEEPPARANGVPVVAFTGPFTEQSGVLDVAAVLADLPVVARFAGSGPLLAQLQATGADVTVTDDPRVQRAVLDTADLAVTAGRTTTDGDGEAWGRTAVEAQAAGVPVVCTRNGGLAQWVCPEGAVLVASHGEVRRSLAAGLSSLLARPDDWAAMGRAGREHVRAHLDERRQVVELERLWVGLARRGPLSALAGGLERPPDQY